jgi:hypothetical protein
VAAIPLLERELTDVKVSLPPRGQQCYRRVMPIEWTISHGARLVVAVAKGELQPEHMRDFLQAIDREGARPYAKMIDVKGLTTRFEPEQVGAFAAIVREREVDSVVGPIAIVVGPGVIAQQARAFSERGHLVRPIRVFAELHEARRWLDQQLGKTVDPRSSGASVVPPMKIE